MGQESKSTSRRRYAVLTLAALLALGSLSMMETSMAFDLKESADTAYEEISLLVEDLNISDKVSQFSRQIWASQELRRIAGRLDIRNEPGFPWPTGWKVPSFDLSGQQSGTQESGWQEAYDNGRRFGKDHAATDETADMGYQYSQGFLAGYLDGYHAERGISADLAASVNGAPGDSALEILLTLRALRSDGAPLSEADVQITANCQQGQVIPSSQSGRTTSAGEFETVWRYIPSQESASSSGASVHLSARVSKSGKEAQAAIDVDMSQSASPPQSASIQQMQLSRTPAASDPKSSYPAQIEAPDLGQFPRSDSDILAPTGADPGSSWYNLGQEAAAAGRYQDAIGYFEKAIEQDPPSAMAWEGKGTSQVSLGNYQEAIASYQMAAELDPGWAMPWGRIGDALFAMERYDEAISSYDKAIALDPEWAVVWEGKGFALEALGRYEESKVALSKAWELGGSR